MHTLHPRKFQVNSQHPSEQLALRNKQWTKISFYNFNKKKGERGGKINSNTPKSRATQTENNVEINSSLKKKKSRDLQQWKHSWAISTNPHHTVQLLKLTWKAENHNSLPVLHIFSETKHCCKFQNSNQDKTRQTQKPKINN